MKEETRHRHHLFFELKPDWIKPTPTPTKIEDVKFFDGKLNYDHPTVTLYHNSFDFAEIPLKDHYENGFYGNGQIYGKDAKIFLTRLKNKRDRWKFRLELSDYDRSRMPTI